MTKGKVTGVVGNLVTVEVNGPVGQNEICYIHLEKEKLMSEVIKVKGNIVNQSGTNLWINNDVYIIGTSADNSFSMSGGTLYLAGVDNFPQSFENISRQLS